MEPAVKFLHGLPISVRLTPAANTALGIPDADVALYAAAMDDGWLLADYRDASGNVTRYALPPGSVVYVKQALTADQAGNVSMEPNVIPRNP